MNIKTPDIITTKMEIKDRLEKKNAKSFTEIALKAYDYIAEHYSMKQVDDLWLIPDYTDDGDYIFMVKTDIPCNTPEYIEFEGRFCMEVADALMLNFDLDLDINRSELGENWVDLMTDKFKNAVLIYGDGNV